MKLKNILTAVALLCAAAQTKANDWKQWSVIVSPVYSVSVSDFKFTTVRQGGGIGGELFILDNLSLGAQGVTYDVKNSTVDEASATLNYYVPIKESGLFVVGTLGTLKGFEENENWQYKTGAGIGAKIGESVVVRVGGYIVDDFQSNTELRFEAGLGVKF